MQNAPFTLDLAPGQLATVVTTLEMRQRAAPRGAARGAWDLVRHTAMPPDLYRDLFRHVGQQWLWSSRLAMEEVALTAIIHDPRVEVWVLTVEGAPEGLLELDFRELAACELAFFGVAPALIGTGAGRWLMDQAIGCAWGKPIGRFWVHTCTLDHPAALSFYRRSGFVPVRRQIEIADDPRLLGLLPREAAPQVPIISAAAHGW